MIRKILATADNTRLAKSRKAHGLGLVELWVLKGCQSNQPISQRWCKFFFRHINLVTNNKHNLFGQWACYGVLFALPFSLAFFCSGSAIRFPKPPFGKVSWFGKKRSYESRPISGRCSMVSVRRKKPIFRDNTAGSGSEKRSIHGPRSRSENAQAQRLHHGTCKFQEMLTRHPSMWFCQNPQRETKMFHQARGDKHQS